MAIVYLSLGSNIGDRIGYLQQATALISAVENINIVATSSFYETEPWQMNSEQWFVNAVIQISTTLSPLEVLELCKRIEKQLGRKLTQDNSDNRIYTDRTIAIDILFYDKEVINTEELIIPHRFFQRRAFMMIPMLEIAEDFVHPVFNKTIEELYDDLENPETVVLYGTMIEDEGQ